MLTKIYTFITSNSSIAKRLIWKYWYQLISGKNRPDEFIFMNYGFVNGENINLKKEDEPHRPFIQLYNKVVSPISIKDKIVLEVGSGRGGGAYFVARYLEPKELIGIDISQNAVNLCNAKHKSPNLIFKVGDSENISFESEKFEVVYNVESSHCYGSREKFTKEVFRVLKNGGYFCWADLCSVKDWEDVNKYCNSSGFKIIFSENITKNVLLALDEITETKEKSINLFVPKFIQKTFKDFAGVKDTKVYNAFKSGELQYYHIVAQK